MREREEQYHSVLKISLEFHDFFFICLLSRPSTLPVNPPSFELRCSESSVQSSYDCGMYITAIDMFGMYCGRHVVFFTLLATGAAKQSTARST